MYEFLCLMFGLGPAPRIFTKLMKVPISMLRKLKIRLIIYMDDMLIMGCSLEEIIWARDTTLHLLGALGFVILQKISVGPNEEAGIPRHDSGQCSHVPPDPRGKATKLDTSLHKDPEGREIIAEENFQSAGEVKINSSSLLLGPSPDKTLTTAFNQWYEKKSIVRVLSETVERGRPGVKMVDREFRTSQWQSHLGEPAGHLDIHRCSEGITGGLGGRMPRFPHRGSVEKGRERSPHQRSGVDGSRNGFVFISEREEQHLGTSTVGQPNSFVLSKEDGRHEVGDVDRNSEKNMVLSVAKEHTYP